MLTLALTQRCGKLDQVPDVVQNFSSLHQKLSSGQVQSRSPNNLAVCKELTSQKSISSVSFTVNFAAKTSNGKYGNLPQNPKAATKTEAFCPESGTVFVRGEKKNIPSL